MTAVNEMHLAMTERDLDRAVQCICRDLGLLVFHAWDSRHSGAGFPDLCIAGTAVVFAELKTMTGQLRPAQITWRDRLIGAGATWFLWRPPDLADGSITRSLARISYLRQAGAR
jgi:hypothetical protein